MTQQFDEADGKPLVLYEPAHDVWQQMQGMLDARCNKEELLRYAETFKPWLEQYPQIMRATSDGNVVVATECAAMMKSSSIKWEIAQGVALILSDDRNMQAYIATLKPEMMALWRTVLSNIFVSQQTAKMILHTSNNLYKEEQSYYYSTRFKWNRYEYGWFALASLRSGKVDRWGYREYENFITVNAFIHCLFFPYFFPEVYDDDTSLGVLPVGNWRTVNTETESITAFHLFNGLFQHDEFPLKKKGIGLADLKRAQKKLALTEFFPDGANEFRQNLRSHSYMQLLALNEYLRPVEKRSRTKLKQEPQEPALRTYQDVLRELLSHLSRFVSFLPALLFPHVKGLRKQMTDYSRDIRLCTIATTLLREEPERWIGVSDMLLKVYLLESDGTSSRYSTLVYYPSDERDYGNITNEYSGQIITADHYTQEFGYTGLQSLMFMLCSLGVVEIAINEDSRLNISPFAPLEYVRLTPLGRYALGLTDEYEAPEQEHVAYFELDPDRLIIRSLVEPNPYAQLLKDTSVPISKNRFETSALSFLANCHTKADVEGKIKIFRQFISNELPPLWERFFKSLLQHCNPLKEDKQSYKRYTLDPENRDLVQLVTTDPVLRQIVIRAENYRIMVKTEDLKKFETQLKKHGYLL